jgi:putative SbcD/Mre11-related phosphoesterase
MVVRGYRVSDELELLPGGGAYLRDEGVLMVADLHLGCEASLEYEGLSVPRVQTERVRASLLEMVGATDPERLVVVGDLKHNFDRNLRQEWDDVSSFVTTLTEKTDLEVIRGNHDNFLPMILSRHGVRMVDEASLGGFRVLHGHRGSVEGGPAVLAHLHPSIGLRDSLGPRVKQPCFLYLPGERILVLPAMSILAGGVDVLGEGAGRMLTALSELGIERFLPVAFAGDRPLRFPEVGAMRS